MRFGFRFTFGRWTFIRYTDVVRQPRCAWRDHWMGTDELRAWIGRYELRRAVR